MLSQLSACLCCFQPGWAQFVQSSCCDTGRADQTGPVSLIAFSALQSRRKRGSRRSSKRGYGTPCILLPLFPRILAILSHRGPCLTLLNSGSLLPLQVTAKGKAVPLEFLPAVQIGYHMMGGLSLHWGLFLGEGLYDEHP